MLQLDPEHHKTGIGISPPEIINELDLLWSVLVWMAVWSMGSVLQGLQRSIISLHPAVDVLAVSVVMDGSFCDAILLCVVDQGLPIQGGLCYLIHGE